MSREILMPQVASDMTEADVVAWLVEPGDPFEAGDVLLEIETEKSTVEIEAPATGALTEILVPAGTSNVAVGTLLARLEEAATASGTNDPEPDAETPHSASPSSAEDALEGLEPSAVETATALPREARPPATALARRIADRSGVDLEGLQGTGPHGRVTRDDVERGGGDSEGLRFRRDSQSDSGRAKQSVGSSLELIVQCRAEALVETMDRLNSIAQGDPESSPIRDIILRAVDQAAHSVPAFFGSGATENPPQHGFRVVAN
ncbi:E3 binding domain-containing protein, partial [Myxococcota bacterium]|nr:E3 binding domain-containing protein [Myxococcota bacterium]